MAIVNIDNEVKDPPLHGIFANHVSFEKVTTLISNRISSNSLIVSEKSSWMDVSLAGAIASKTRSGVVALNFAGLKLQESPSAVGFNLPPGSKVLLCCTWVNTRTAARLEAFVKACEESYQLKFIGVIAIRFEQSSATAFFKGVGRVIAVSVAEGDGPKWDDGLNITIDSIDQSVMESLDTTSSTKTARSDASDDDKISLKRQRTVENDTSFDNVSKVLSFCSHTFAANDPSEDRHAESKIAWGNNLVDEKEDEVGYFFVVADGHGGHATSEYVAEHLLPNVQSLLKRKLNKAPEDISKSANGVDGDVKDGVLKSDDSRHESIKSCLIDGFAKTEEDFLDLADAQFSLNNLWRGQSGSCVVLVAVIEGWMYTAHLGDCRAVLVTSSPPLPPDPPPSVSATSSSSSSSSSLLSSSSGVSLFRSKGPNEVNKPFDLRTIPLTYDHNCYNPAEVKLVENRVPTDQNPIRASKTDLKGFNKSSNGSGEKSSTASNNEVVGNSNSQRDSSSPILRIAGSLAITRAIGDFYLKYSRWAPEELKPHVPYIISVPEVSHRKLDRVSDICVLLATDGLFEISSNQQIVHWIKTYLTKKFQQDNVETNQKNNNGIRSTRGGSMSLSRDIIEKSLSLVASAQCMSGVELGRLKPGPSRRHIHDDITVTTVILQGAKHYFTPSIPPSLPDQHYHEQYARPYDNLSSESLSMLPVMSSSSLLSMLASPTLPPSPPPPSSNHPSPPSVQYPGFEYGPDFQRKQI